MTIPTLRARLEEFAESCERGLPAWRVRAKDLREALATLSALEVANAQLTSINASVWRALGVPDDDTSGAPLADRVRTRFSALEAERDNFEQQAGEWQLLANEQEQRAIKAEAENARLRAALTDIAGGYCECDYVKQTCRVCRAAAALTPSPEDGQ